MSTTVKEFRIPLMIGVGALLAALLIWALVVSPQTSKLKSLQAQETTLQTQQTTLQVKLASLKTEQQKLSGNCADLQKISTQIPSVQSPTDIDAEESSFESQFNALTSSAGVTLTQFSGFAGATGASATTPTTTASTSGSTPTSSDDVVAVPTTLAVTGNYGQMSAFVKGLDTFPRLFVIQNFVLSLGTTVATSSSSGSSSGGSSTGSSTSPLWVGGTSTSATAGPYALGITGSIYYTSTPSALDACIKAAAAVSK
jgi:Tfp pilus assembly protein PilO